MSIIRMHLHNQRKWHSQPRGPASQLKSLHLGTQQIGSLQRAPFIEQLDLKFQRPRKGGRREFLDSEEFMSGLQDEDYRGAWHLLCQFLHEQRRISPVYCGEYYKDYEDDP